MGHTQEAGMRAERIAEEDYLKQGYRLVARNFRGRRGEIDLIFARAGTLLFVEVKGRSGPWEPHACAASWRRKRLRLRAAMREYLARFPEMDDAFDQIDWEIAFVTQGRVAGRFRGDF